MTTTTGSRHSTTADARTTGLAWLATLALSSLPMIVLHRTVGLDPAAVSGWLLTAAVPVAVTARRWAPARPLRPYLLVLLPVFCVAYVLPPVLAVLPPADGSPLVRALVSKAAFLLLAAAVAAVVVVGLRVTPAQAYLTAGAMAAPSGRRLPGMTRPLSWAVLGTAITVAFLVAFGVPTWLETGLGTELFPRVAPVLPLVIGAAALNSLAEEVIYRAAPLAALAPAVGPRQAVLLTSVWFGLAHYFGSVPEGAAGVVASGVLGLLLGTTMTATRGIGWPWLIHFTVDLVVFASIGAAP